jgi:uncharacterized protein YndB with AHSA1/START domain
MTTNTRVLSTTPDRVWDVLADGWLYPLWVVGATRMRGVDDTWPQVGSRLHHSVGVWPVVLNDDTEVLACDTGRSMKLRARGWPLGEADVTLRLTPSGEGTLVEIEEKPVSGPGALLPPPVAAVGIKVRNVESLRRLAFIAEGRTRDPGVHG